MLDGLGRLRRDAQSRAVRAVRRSRVFPRSMVDRQGDAAPASRLADRVMVFFPGPPDQIYQLLPWLDTLRAVHAAHGCTIVCQDSRVSAALRAASSPPVVVVPRYGALDALLGRSDVALALYAGHASANFECLRFSSLLHAYIGHGDSDKGVSASNQLKAYDRVLAPGPAAVRRIEQRLMLFDAAERCVVVGQPVAFTPPPAAREAAARTTVLYAPTWEGAQPSVSYSSVVSHGRAIAESLLADPRYRLLYRPHPLTGVTSGAYSAADRAIRSAIVAAGAPHAVSLAEQEPLEAGFAAADVLVADVSAVATGWLPSRRPLLVTRAGGEAVDADVGMLAVVPRLDAGQDAAAAVTVAVEDEGGAEQRAGLVTSYLSEYWPDRSTARFVEVVGGLVAERDRLRAALLAGGSTGV